MCADQAAAPRPGRQERGFALAVSIFALVIIAALVTGAFFTARQEMRIGLNSRTSARAFAAAEAGLNTSIAQWQTGTWNMLAAGDSATISGNLGSGGGSYTGTVRRLNTELFLIRSTGTDPTTSAQRTLAALTRLQLVEMDFDAALTTRGPMKVGGSAELDGRDAIPSAWGGCPTSGLDTLPGVVISDTANITYTGNSYRLYGDPPIQADPTMNDSSFFKYGDTDWNELVAMATKIYPTGSVGPLTDLGAVGTTTTCNTAVMSNWGDPYRRAATQGCWGYFPIIYVDGTLKITGGYGQGILLVSGDLEVAGGAEFFGPVIVRGSLKTTGTGGHFNGGVMAANVDLEQSTVLGDAIISYSSCAVTTALQASAPGRLVRERSWAEVF